MRGMREEPDYVEVANRELREPFKNKLFRLRGKMLSPGPSNPMDRVSDAKLRRDAEAYKRGLREGWDQALWAMLALGVIVFFVVSYFPT